MEVRDPVHGPIPVLNIELPILQHPFYQRLRGIKQLGLTEYIFPGATHTRYLHSMGVMHLSCKIFDKVFSPYFSSSPHRHDFQRLRETLRLACLLHDIGHAPLSHSTESVMPMLQDLGIPTIFKTLPPFQHNRQATHEDYTFKAIVDSSLIDVFADLQKDMGVSPQRVAELIIGHTLMPEYFTIAGLNFFPCLHQLVSSELDCDRMDYLLRDSYFCGVSYGRFDLDWIVDNLQLCTIDNKAYLAISDRAIWAFDDFLLGRFHMFLMVYFHYRAVCLEQLLMRYFRTSPGEYAIPAPIEEYQKHDDHFLMKILRHSQNKYAKMIIQNQIPPKIFESVSQDTLKLLDHLENYLKQENIEYIKCSSQGRLSKYYSQFLDQTSPPAMSTSAAPLYVVRSFRQKQQAPFIEIDKATMVYEKFSKTHTVIRIYCQLNELPSNQQTEILRITSGDIDA